MSNENDRVTNSGKSIVDVVGFRCERCQKTVPKIRPTNDGRYCCEKCKEFIDVEVK